MTKQIDSSPLVKIYGGSLLSPEAVRRHLPVAVHGGSAKNGSLYLDISKGVSVVGIVEGEIGGKNALSPGEIMDALRGGLTIYGSSQLGALRAVETWRYGMIGHGQIFEDIRDASSIDEGQIVLLSPNYRKLAHADALALLQLIRADLVAVKKLNTLMGNSADIYRARLNQVR